MRLRRFLDARPADARDAVLDQRRAVLSNALQWTATPVGVPDTDVAGVQFIVDARVRWTERHPPYVFNGDGNELFPWALGPGAHRLAVRVLTRGGASGSTAAAITVSATPPVPIALIGTYKRDVTAANVRRTQAFGHEPADEVLPTGVWRLLIERDGVITFEDPDGGGGDEAFTATPDGTFTLQDPANWLLPPTVKAAFAAWSRSAFMTGPSERGVSYSPPDTTAAPTEARCSPATGDAPRQPRPLPTPTEAPDETLL